MTKKHREAISRGRRKQLAAKRRATPEVAQVSTPLPEQITRPVVMTSHMSLQSRVNDAAVHVVRTHEDWRAAHKQASSLDPRHEDCLSAVKDLTISFNKYVSACDELRRITSVNADAQED